MLYMLAVMCFCLLRLIFIVIILHTRDYSRTVTYRYAHVTIFFLYVETNETHQTCSHKRQNEEIRKTKKTLYIAVFVRCFINFAFYSTIFRIYPTLVIESVSPPPLLFLFSLSTRILHLPLSLSLARNTHAYTHPQRRVRLRVYAKYIHAVTRQYVTHINRSMQQTRLSTLLLFFFKQQDTKE